jgi:hypothetical protein
LSCGEHPAAARDRSALRADSKSRLLPIGRLFDVHDPVFDLLVGDGLDRCD